MNDDATTPQVPRLESPPSQPVPAYPPNAPYQSFPTVPPYIAPPPPWYPPIPMQGNAQGLGGRFRRFWGANLGNKLLVLVPVLLAICVIAAAGAIVAARFLPRPDGYLSTNDREVQFLQWTEDSNGHMNGSLQSEAADDQDNVKTGSYAFTGQRSGSQVSITFSVLGISETFTGSLDGNTLTIQVPDQNGTIATQVFQAASVSDYNTAATTLRQRIEHQAAATRSAQATVSAQQAAAQATASTQASLDQAVADANRTLAGALSTLQADTHTLGIAANFTDTLNAYAKDWGQMQADYQKEVTDYQQGCGVGGYNKGVVQYDAGVVTYDLGTIQYDDGSLQYVQNQVSPDVTAVNNDIASVNTAWSNLQAAASANPSGTVRPQFGQTDVASAVALAQGQLDASGKAGQTAKDQAAQYNKEASDLNTTAQNLANGMVC